jgi:hypothetical protein
LRLLQKSINALLLIPLNLISSPLIQDPQWCHTKQPALIPDSAIQQVQTWLEIDGVSVAKFVTKLYGPQYAF